MSEVKVLTRGGLAALLSVELPLETFSAPSAFPIAVDVSDHWARKDILSVVKLGLLSVPANHRFQPDLPVTRGEMAGTLYNIIMLQELTLKPDSLAGDIPRDLPPNHTAYHAVRAVLKARVMHVDSAGRFNLTHTVSGSEASGYLKKIARFLSAPR
ncbi:MAG: S-layer homology domain-containing protein [bacterium]|nr:S-layer homology domain-containing protein [bacterium]